MVGAAFFLVPGIGPVVVGGSLVAAIVGALEGGVVVGGLSAIGAGLYSLSIPKDSVLEYETAIKRDKFLLIAHLRCVAKRKQCWPIELKTENQNADAAVALLRWNRLGELSRIRQRLLPGGKTVLLE